MDQDALKQAAAAAALELITDRLVPDAVIGVGTGSTANCFIDALAAHRGRFDAAVASSRATAERLKGHGIMVLNLNSAPPLAVYVDGADEVDPHLRLIKGGGGALTGEKIIAAAAEEFVCIVDDSKCVDILGRHPLPVEVIPMARSLVGRALVTLGGQPEWRQGFETDHGNWILDVHGLDIVDPVGLESEIDHLAGVVCNGLFARRPADVLVVAGADGVDVRRA